MTLKRLFLTAAIGVSMMTGFSTAVMSHDDLDSPKDNTVQLRKQVDNLSAQWSATSAAKVKAPRNIKILGFNDFHGQLSTGKLVGTRPVGGAAVLASYLHAAEAQAQDGSIIVHAGDFVGASPAASALLQDEPSITFLNMLANDACNRGKMNRACNMVGTLGNHEFDEGLKELKRLLNGGNYSSGPFLENPWKGSVVPYVNANVVRTKGGQTVLPPYVIKKIKDVNIAFIGAVLKETPTIVTPSGVAGLTFKDEAAAINQQVAKLKSLGIHAIVVTIHQGQSQGASNENPTNPNGVAPASGAIVDIVKQLDDDVDIVVSGHSHSFMNTLIPNSNGKKMLVVQAFSASTAYDDIDVTIDPITQDVVAMSARVLTTWADQGPGLTPDAAVANLVAQAETTVAPLINQIVGTASVAITTAENSAGESLMGNLIADAQKASTHTEIAFMNAGGIRAGLAAGPVTWGNLFTVQPFGNTLVTMKMTGAQILTVLEQQWQGQPYARIMKTSGITYTWDNAQPAGSRIVAGSVKINGVPLVTSQTYTVTCNNFMATGGDNFTAFKSGTNQTGGAVDLDALITYVKGLSQPFGAAIEGRINRQN
ncbi:MAG TPA: bifunctional metallophosphatase/5'-nucleotidase [Rhizomicrobium sp.]|nr:bifunctional metallophosphatase/5'-nucleotidase [Rhizomicrobium sp.]